MSCVCCNTPLRKIFAFPFLEVKKTCFHTPACILVASVFCVYAQMPFESSPPSTNALGGLLVLATSRISPPLFVPIAQYPAQSCALFCRPIIHTPAEKSSSSSVPDTFCALKPCWVLLTNPYAPPDTPEAWYPGMDELSLTAALLLCGLESGAETFCA